MTRRDRYRDGLSSLYLPVYDNLCSILPDEWQPYCGVRTFAEQKKLYDRGRVNNAQKITDAGPGTSPHNYGCASDWTIFNANGKPVWVESHDPAWKVYSVACGKAGARWGIHITSGIDSVHNELPITKSWNDVYGVYLNDGMGKALAFISEHLVKYQ